MKKLFSVLFLSKVRARACQSLCVRMTMLLLLLTISIGNVWGANQTYAINTPSQNVYTDATSGITVIGTKATGKIDNSTSQKIFSAKKDQPLHITSIKANIKGIRFDYDDSSSGSGSENIMNIQTSDGASLATLTSGYMGSISVNGGASTSLPASLAGLAVGKDQSKHCSISVDFSSAVSTIVVNTTGSNAAQIRNLNVIYDDEISARDLYATITPTGANVYSVSGEGSMTTASINNTKMSIGGSEFYQLNGSNTYTPTESLVAGDIVVFTVGNTSVKSIGINIERAGALSVDKGIASQSYQIVYVVPAAKSSISFVRNNSDTYLKDVKVYHNTSTPSTKTVYFVPSAKWKEASAKFAVWNKNANSGAGEWVNNSFMTQVSTCQPNVYKMDIPTSCSELIFVRINPDAATPSWADGTKWAQTADLTISQNCFTMTGSEWSTDGSWSTFAPATYSITYKANGGTGDDVVVNGIACGDSHTVKAADTFTRTNWSFLTWKQGGTGTERAAGSTIENISSNIDLYAHWEKWSISGDFDGTGWKDYPLVDGSVTIPVTSGANREFVVLYQKTDATDVGYKNTGTMTSDNCTGWTMYTDAGSNCKITPTITGDYVFRFNKSTKALSVTYPVQKYTVTYAANGGTGTMSDATQYAAGDQVTILSNAFTAPTGKQFASWSVTDASSNPVTVTDGKFTMPASNVTITAQWEPIIATESVRKIIFSNGFDAFIDNSTNTIAAYYMEGTPVPTISTWSVDRFQEEDHTGVKSLEIVGDKIVLTNSIDGVREYTLTLAEKSPLTTTGALQTFDGTETYIASSYGWDNAKKWKLAKYVDTDKPRITSGNTRMYIYTGQASKATITASSIHPSYGYNVYINNGDAQNFKSSPFEVNLSTSTNNIICIESAQGTNGDGGIASILLTPTPVKWEVYHNAGGDWEGVEMTAGSATINGITKEQAFKFKIRKTTDAGSNYTYYGAENEQNSMTEQNCTNWTLASPGNNINITAGVAGAYTFSFDENANQLDVTYPASYSITYAGGDGATGSMDPQTLIAYNEEVTLTTNTFAKTDYHFAGWKDQDENVIADGAQVTVTKDLTLTAQWIPAVTSVTVTAAGDKTTLYKGETVQLTATCLPDNAWPADKAITWSSANSALVSVTSDGLARAVAATDGTVITARSANGKEAQITIVVDESCVSWMIHYWNDQPGNKYSGQACFTKANDDPSDDEYRTDFILKTYSQYDMLWVGDGQFSEHSANWDTRGIMFYGLKNGNCGANYYPGQDVEGELVIHTNSTSENYGLTFDPIYSFAYYNGSEWTQTFFHRTGTVEEETDLIMVPNGYADGDGGSYEYYVGLKQTNNPKMFHAEKSKTTKLKNMPNMPNDKGGTYGKFHIYDNSCSTNDQVANNWYCTFIPYYNVSYYIDGEFVENSEFKASTGDKAARTISFKAAPEKQGYTFVGWRRYNSDVVIDAGADYAVWTGMERFDAVWGRNSDLNVTLSVGANIERGYTSTLNVQSRSTGAITYESDNVSVARIEWHAFGAGTEEYPQVIAVAPGTAHITVNQAATDQYAAGSKVFDVTVTNPTLPYLSTLYSFTCTGSTLETGEYSATGGTADLTKSSMSEDTPVEINNQKYYKPNTSSAWTFTLEGDKTFQEGDVITIAITSNENKGVTLQINGAPTESISLTANTVTQYVIDVKNNDGFVGKSSFTLVRGTNGSSIRFGTVTVTRATRRLKPTPAGQTRSFATFAASINWSLASDEVTAYTTHIEDDVVKMRPITPNAVIPAFTGVLLAGPSEATYDIEWRDRDVVTISNDQLAQNELLGTTELRTFDQLVAVNPDPEQQKSVLYMSTNRMYFIRLSASGQLAGQKAYLPWEYGNTNIPTRFVFDSEYQLPTSLNEQENVESGRKVLVDGRIYILRGTKVFDLNGRLLRDMTK